jgi:hypothetical protein
MLRILKIEEIAQLAIDLSNLEKIAEDKETGLFREGYGKEIIKEVASKLKADLAVIIRLEEYGGMYTEKTNYIFDLYKF